VDTSKTPVRDALVKAIEAHLAAHPLATDSAAGVARWWLGGAAVSVGIDDVEVALATLVDQAVLRRLSLADGSVLYASAVPTRQ
jgi:hypothetical protein